MIDAAYRADEPLLIVEDNPADADWITTLCKSGAPQRQIVHVSRLADVTSPVTQTTFGAVLLDLRLPDGVGVECVERVHAQCKDAPIIVLTGAYDESLAVACIAAGAQDFLLKQELAPATLTRALACAHARARERLERRHAEAMKAHLAAIVESSQDAILSVSFGGVITSWNGGATAMFGYTAQEAIGRHVNEIVRPVDADAAREQAESIANPRPLYSGIIERRRLRKDGSELVIAVRTFELRDASGRPLGSAGICRDVTERYRREAELRRANEELRLRDDNLRALVAKQTAVLEAERTRIAREVHDELGQALTGIKMDLHWLARHGEQSARALERLRDAETLVDETILTVQRIALELRPSALDALGLVAALADEARRFEVRTNVRLAAELDPDAKPPAEIATVLFRVAQELLSNVARHARATFARLWLQADAGAWTLCVQDNGVGAPKGIELEPTSLGLLGIRERVERVGGNLAFVSGDEGTCVLVSIPRREHA